jgi:hypothetical protein
MLLPGYIKSKEESDLLIHKIGVNYTPFEIAYSLNHAYEILHNFDYNLLGIREKKIGNHPGGGKFLCGLSRLEVFEYLNSNKIEYPIGIYQDMKFHEQLLIYHGEICLFPDGSLHARYCDIPNIKMRDAMKHPKAINVNIDNTSYQWGWDYKPLREIIDYLCEYHIIGSVVEFSQYSIKAGCKNENIVIWEIRNY